MEQQFEEGITLDRFIFETTRAQPNAQGQFATPTSNLQPSSILFIRQSAVGIDSHANLKFTRKTTATRTSQLDRPQWQ